MTFLLAHLPLRMTTSADSVWVMSQVAPPGRKLAKLNGFGFWPYLVGSSNFAKMLAKRSLNVEPENGQRGSLGWR